MQKALILIVVITLFPACAILEPDDGRHYSPPTFHYKPYEPAKPPEKSTYFDTISITDSTVKMDY